jgi:hypothetical protein
MGSATFVGSTRLCVRADAERVRLKAHPALQGDACTKRER